MGAREIAARLNARRSGRGWVARCPAHADRHPSLSITEAPSGKVHLKCFAGCPPTEVFAALSRVRNGGKRAGLSVDGLICPLKDPSDIIERIWSQGRPIAGSTAARYLSARGLSDVGTEALRFHPRLRHPTSTYWPGIIARATHGLTGDLMGLHRTFLKPDGSGKAPVQPDKMMLGPCAGGAVRLAPSADRLMVGEGIETVLSAMQATGLPGWAALSTSGLQALRLPPEVGEMVILADADPAGEAAAVRAARRWTSERRRVRIARPPEGLDFNDVLQGRGGCREA